MRLSLLIRVASISVATFMIGAAIFFGANAGVGGILFSPILALLGFYYLSPVTALVVAAWTVYSPEWRSWIQQVSFVVACAGIGYGAGIVLGRGSRPELVEAFRLACTMCGGFAGFLVSRMKKASAGEGGQQE